VNRTTYIAARVAICLLLAAVVACGTAAAQDASQRIAVLDFHDSSEGGVKPREVLYLSDLVRGAARRSLPAEHFLLMTRENILDLLPEGRTLADCVGECAVETGRRIGADHVVTGEVTMFAGEIRVTVNLHETASGNLLGQIRAGAPTLLAVEQDLDQKILELLAALRGAPSRSGEAGVVEQPLGGGATAWSAAGVSEEVVTFASQPAGAMVEIDGQPIGETPCSRALIPGVYQVGIKKVRYVAHTQTLEVRARTSPAVSTVLTPDFGWITVESEPAGLPVTIDEKSVGQTPLTAMEIDTGPHDILVNAENYHAEGRRVVIDRGEREVVRVTPVPRNGGLKVLATDTHGNAVAARVKIGGIEVGRAYQPITLMRGKHRVIVESEESSWTGEAVVEEARITDLAVKLDSKMPPVGAANSSGAAPRMVNIPAGGFTMGSPTSEENRDSDESQHRVEITQGFYLSATEVTQAQYELVMGSNPSNFKGVDRPVEKVSWRDAVQYCNKLSAREGLSPAYLISGTSVTWDARSNGYRLPTEAEWEYACRAGTTTAYCTGGSEADLARAGWYSGNAGSETHPVGKKLPNAWGLYDMHGNVWEWCWDWYGEYGSGTQRDPQGAADGSYRVFRGGFWSYDAGRCRSAFRNWDIPSSADYNLGFRVARSSAR
jgi:formylglycine-generating enzyme required for sulfatase activity